jgi:hypothetical protein
VPREPPTGHAVRPEPAAVGRNRASPSAPSNADFDRRLRAQDAEWGVRDLTDVTRLALEAGFERERVVVRPANNHVLVFRLR